MNRRQRLERKLEKRQQWAESRERKAEAAFDGARESIAGIPPGQPILVGHHSERRHRADLDRHDRKMRAGFESAEMAKHHASKADGIERQLDNSIFSDDDNATEALRERIEQREAKRALMKRINAAHRAFVKAGRPDDLAALKRKFSDLNEAAWIQIRTYQPAYSWEPHPFPPYAFQNLGGLIRADKKRIEQIKRQRAQAAKAEAAGGVVVEVFKPSPYPSIPQSCSVTFAEKPDRSILTALKAAGFYWSSGSWHGSVADLPECVSELQS